MATSNVNEPTYTDLSHLCPVDTAILGGASMSAGNTVSTQPVIHGAPGSNPANPMPPGAMPDNKVSVDVGSQVSYTKKVGK